MPEERRRNLAETYRGSYYNQEEWLEEFLDDERAFYNGSESSDSDNNNEDNNENNKQQQLSEGSANNCCKMVLTVLLQELINDFAVCKRCSGTLLLVEDVASSHGFSRMWNFTCEKDNYLSNSLKARSITPKRNRYFEINCAAVLAFRSIGKGHSGAKKVKSILNIDKPINAYTWRGHTEAISEYSEKIMDLTLKLEAHNAKLYLCKIGQLNRKKDELNGHNVAISACFDGFWNTGGWSSRTGIVDACFEPNGKVLDFIAKFFHCKNCQDKKSKYNVHQMTTLQYLT